MKALLFIMTLAWFAAITSARSHEWRPDQIIDLETAAADASAEGLAPRSSVVESVELARLAALFDPSAQARLNGAVDGLFRNLAQAYARGDVNPRSVDPSWRMEQPQPPDFAVLDTALAWGAQPSSLLRSLLPQSPEYRALREELARLYADENEPDRASKLLQARANMERWRWLPRDLPASRLEVRIPQFQVTLFRDAVPVRTHDVIVGARKTPTPTFTAVVQSLTLNPYWDPPTSIERNELLSRFRRNPAAAVREGFEGVGSDGRIVNAARINWAAQPFPYNLRQRPGPKNALGQIRINLPNPYAIYLHDTPAKSLFEREKRAFSHGCVRVRDPLGLAAVLLDSMQWDEAALQREIDKGDTVRMSLSAPIPIYILYLTTALQPDGSIAYLDDIYNRDKTIVKALDAPKVAAAALDAADADTAQSCAR